MSNNYGPGLSRVLITDDTQYLAAIHNAAKPPCDSEFLANQLLAFGAIQSLALREMPSGWLGNETNTHASFYTNPSFSNYFEFGGHRSGELNSITYANVHGWLIPVAGTHTGLPPGSPSTDTKNVITLDPSPSTDARTDVVFLEVWQARIQPNPITTNKPSASGIYRYGNCESGSLPITDDLIDAALGFQTTDRLQIQYRIRVVSGVLGLTTNPDGFDSTVVKGQGAALAPVPSFYFINQRVNGDPGLWRAGDGNSSNALGTVDGYSYAIPMAAVFRRNSTIFTSSNLNGGFNRNPTAVDRTGYKTFSGVATLAANLTAAATSATLVSVTNIPLPTNPATPVLIQIGDELLTYASITGVTLNTLNRHQNGTIAEPHKAGSVVRIISGRPDGLFSDQIANTDILDLRHVVNPNGFDYDTLLKTNLDKLLRGQLRANWKRSGNGTQGPFVFYQDAIQSAAVPSGVTQLDAPDNIRMIYSDAATIQPIECIVKPNDAPVLPGPGTNINVTWSLGLTVKTTLQSVDAKFTAGDIIIIPVNQLLGGLQAGSTDQVRWLNDSVVGAISLRLDGETADLPSSMYTVTPAIPTSSDDLTITLSGTFPQQDDTATKPALLHIKVHAVYGAGRGISRKPDSIHSISYQFPSSELLIQESGTPANNLGSRIAWAPLWSKYRSAVYNNCLPTTAEMYADLGSKTVIATPFRRINFPDVLTIDGDAANPNPTPKAGLTGTTAGVNATLLTVNPTDTAAQYDALVIASGPGAGRYTIVNVVPNTSITVDRGIKAQAGSFTFNVYAAQGVMPLLKKDGVTPKWTQTDPLGLFCGQSAGALVYTSIYVSLPRHLIPGWGALYLPTLNNEGTTFSRGINFMSNSRVGGTGTHGDADKNFVNYTPSSVNTYATFSTLEFIGMGPINYNTQYTYTSLSYAGIRQFTDTRGLGRQGLELPPFYGIARLFAVYEAVDYKTNGSAFDPNTRAYVGGHATNLLRQNLPQSEGPVVWIEIDADGDSTFILNANALDLSKSPNPIASFAAGDYVIEASIFGFDRGTFDLDSEARLVLTKPTGGDETWNRVGTSTPDLAIRSNNINKYVAGPSAILPGPADATNQILVNFSRSSYQFDAWGSASTYVDSPYVLGPITSSSAYQIVSNPLDQEALTRPNQKVLEVLASTGFATTLGTGRLSGDASTDALNFLDVAYSDPTVYPPASAIADRPLALPDNFTSGDSVDVGTEYLGSISGLPLGSLWRDSSFTGQTFGNTVKSPLVFFEEVGTGAFTGLSVNHGEQDEVPLTNAASGVGSPGDALVLVDGEQTNYSLLVNYRTHRGGSVFTANGERPGGALDLVQPSVTASASHTNVLQGRAMLVRNSVTNVGASEVSAGDELMLLVVTTVQQLKDTNSHAGIVACGTAGLQEGNSAADACRIEGHPLIRNNVRMVIDSSTIILSR